MATVVVRIIEVVTLYLVSFVLFVALFLAVILEIVSGILDPTIVINTI